MRKNLKNKIALLLAGVVIVGSTFNEGAIAVQAKESKIQMDVPALKDSVTEVMGDSFLVGGSICVSDLSDSDEMDLVCKHFNAVTFGNELKPDSMFGYSNDRCPGTHTDTLNGKEIVVPNTDFSRGEKLLEYVYKYNEQNPENKLKVRGHVLTWHSQTPEWFFHEDYDASKPYVSKEEMTIRHEWYIKTVLEHFLGEDSKYKDMFYGWDVVNEAVSDGTGTYRNDTENSSWWAVYQSNEFIINAFRFANKYAPASVELYYNDYNECDSKKSDGIAQLLSDVKNAEGTRIDGFGMQGHYRNEETNPSIDDFKKAARKYAAIVDSVQLTELDFQCSSTYDGTKNTYDDEDFKLGLRYLAFYEAMQELKAEGVNFTGMTVWGVVDKYSWLQSRSNVGGGANGSKKQMPLLFNDNYQVKQAYWAFVDTTKLAYPIQSTEIMQSIDIEDDKANNKYGTKGSFGDSKLTAEYVLVWDDSVNKIKAYITASETVDEIALYYVENEEIKKVTATNTKDAVLVIDGDASWINNTATARIDFVLTKGNEKVAFSDRSLSHEASYEAFAYAAFKSFISVPKATVVIDGTEDAIWSGAKTVKLGDNGIIKLLWDEENLYVFGKIVDGTADENSSIDIFIDEKNQKSEAYQSDDKHYTINADNTHELSGQNAKEENIVSVTTKTDYGYNVEASIKWTNIQAYYNMKVGLGLQINNKDGFINWSTTEADCYENTSNFGNIILGREAVEGSGDEEELVISAPENITSGKELNWFERLISKIKNWISH